MYAVLGGLLTFYSHFVASPRSFTEKMMRFKVLLVNNACVDKYKLFL